MEEPTPRAQAPPAHGANGLPPYDVPPPYEYQHGYGYGYAPPLPLLAAPTCRTAIVSLVAGILDWVMGLLVFRAVLPLLPGDRFVNTLIGIVVVVTGQCVAIVTGHIARREIRRSGGRLGGDGLATTGLALGYAGLAVLIALVLLAGLLFFALYDYQRRTGQSPHL